MANLKIIKSANGTVRFFQVSMAATQAVLQPVASMEIKHKSGGDDGEFLITDNTGRSFGFVVSNVVSTQIEPDPELAFNGTTEDLVTLLRTDFFF